MEFERATTYSRFLPKEGGEIESINYIPELEDSFNDLPEERKFHNLEDRIKALPACSHDSYTTQISRVIVPADSDNRELMLQIYLYYEKIPTAGKSIITQYKRGKLEAIGADWSCVREEAGGSKVWQRLASEYVSIDDLSSEESQNQLGLLHESVGFAEKQLA